MMELIEYLTTGGLLDGWFIPGAILMLAFGVWSATIDWFDRLADRSADDDQDDQQIYHDRLRDL